MEKIVKNEIKSIGYAISGIIIAFKTQSNFRIQFVIGVLALLLAFVVNFSRIEWLVLLVSICLVLSAELINTVVEHLVDISFTTYDPKAKIVKDLSAGIVLLVSIIVFVIGLILFIPHLLSIY